MSSMGGGSIFSNEGAMLAAASSFEGSARQMREAWATLKPEADGLAEAWKGNGSQQYEEMKGVAYAYCLQMLEMAELEAGNIRTSATRYGEADAAAARIVDGAGR